MKKLLILSIIILAFFFVSDLGILGNPDPVIYYVDATSGDNDNNGTSTETPWQTIAKVNASSFNAGDSILFKKGEVWREQLIVPSSGSAGLPITFGAYGTGDDPIINGSDVVAGFTELNDDELHISANAASDPYGNEADATTGWTASNSTVASSSTQKDTGSYSILVTDAGATALMYYPIAVTAGITYRLSFKTYAPSTNTSNTPRTLIGSVVGGAEDLNNSYTPTQDTWTARSHDVTANTSETWYIQIMPPLTTGDELYVDNLSFAPYHPNVWEKTSVTTEPDIVYIDDIRGTPGASVATLANDNDWYWESNVLYIYSEDDPSIKTIEAGAIDYGGIHIENKDYITIDGITFEKMNRIGARLTVNNITITNCTVQKTGCATDVIAAIGIRIIGNDGVISNNTLSDIQGDGIYIKDGDGIVIDGNTVGVCMGQLSDNIQSENCTNYEITNNALTMTGTDSIKSNITCGDGGSGGLISGNTCIGGDSGINCGDNDTTVTKNWIKDHTSEESYKGGIVMGMDVIASNITISYNILENNRNGIRIRWSTDNSDKTGIKFYNNMIYNSTDYAVDITGVAGEFKNNLLSTAGIAIFRVGRIPTGYNLASDYNCFYPEANGFINYQETSYNTLSSYQSGESQDTNSLESDPLMTDPTNGDFTLQPTSPCIDAGIDVGLTTDYANIQWPFPKGSAPDIGTYEYYKPIIMSAIMGTNPFFIIILIVFMAFIHRKRQRWH